MNYPRVFRDYTVLVLAYGLRLKSLQEMLEPMGFARIVGSDQDKLAPFSIKQVLPDLVVTARNLGIFSGMQLLAGARKEEATREIAFLVIGDKADLGPGGLAEKVAAAHRAALVPEPLDQDRFGEAVVSLLLPFIDRIKEEAYEKKDLAQEMAEKEDLAGAEKAWQESLAHNPDDMECWLGLAQSQSGQHKLKESESTYLQALKKNPTSFQGFLGLAELYEQQDQFQAAVDVLNKALSIAKSLEGSGKASSRIQFYIGEFQLRLKKLEAAEEAFQAAIEEDPENAQLRAAIGDAYADRGHYKESEEHYQAALALDPDMAHSFNRLGIAYRRQGKFQRALDLYGQARVRHPEDEHLLFNMARTHLEAGKPLEAATLLKEALSYNPEFKTAKVLLGRIEEKFGQQAEREGS